MSKSIKPYELGNVISENLEMYRSEVVSGINKAGKKAVSELVRITKDTAPYNAKAHHRHFVDCIASKTESNRLGDNVHIWYVKSPCHRLTHLLVRGHATGNGGRTKGDPFLHRALDKVRPQYEKDVEEVVKRGK